MCYNYNIIQCYNCLEIPQSYEMCQFQVLLHIALSRRVRKFKSLFTQFSSDSRDLRLYDVLKTQAISAEVSTHVLNTEVQE